jgi:hypothetical protein
LRALGTGCHEFTVDERARSERGREPEYQSEWERLFARFQYALFMYGVGACVAHDVLAAAREVVRLESHNKPAWSGTAPSVEAIQEYVCGCWAVTALAGRT